MQGHFIDFAGFSLPGEGLIVALEIIEVNVDSAKGGLAPIASTSSPAGARF